MTTIPSPGWHYAIPAADDPATWDARARAAYRRRFGCEPSGSYVIIDAPPMRVLVYPLPIRVEAEVA